MNEGTQILVDKAVGLLDSLATQLGLAKEVIFPWYVKQQILEAYVTMAGFGLTLVVGLICAFYCRGQYKTIQAVEGTIEKEGQVYDIMTYVGAVMVVIALMGTVIEGPGVFYKLYNSEYKAMEALLEQLKGRSGGF